MPPNLLLNSTLLHSYKNIKSAPIHLYNIIL